MARRPADLIYSPLPRTGLPLRRLLWLLWAGIACLMLGWGGYVLLVDLQVPSRTSYTGTLRPDADPVTLSLPEGAVLDQILVARNDTVRQGQTLATLDITAMERYIATLEAELIHDRMLRDCLLSGQRPHQPPAPPDSLSDPLATAMQRAVQSCLLDLDTTAALEASRADSQAQLKQERQLVDRYIRVLTSTPDTEASRKEVLQALALSMTRTRIDTRLTELRAQTQSDLLDNRAARLSKISGLETDIRFKSGLRARLLTALETPRLTAPEAGRVLRVRRLPKGTQAAELTQVLEVRPDGTGGYRAGFALPQADRTQIALGRTVQITLLGQLDRVPDLTGDISHIHVADDGQLWADITLDTASTALLDDPHTGLALRGSDTASTIHVQGEDINALESLRQTLARGGRHLRQQIASTPDLISW